jgi:DNA mismatch repair protein MSH6
MRQWWDLKAQHFDTILFFKVGKFYEFYHMDAVTVAQELRILYMKVRVQMLAAVS